MVGSGEGAGVYSFISTRSTGLEDGAGDGNGVTGDSVGIEKGCEVVGW